jgi:hypothetical protein
MFPIRLAGAGPSGRTPGPRRVARMRPLERRQGWHGQSKRTAAMRSRYRRADPRSRARPSYTPTGCQTSKPSTRRSPPRCSSPAVGCLDSNVKVEPAGIAGNEPLDRRAAQLGRAPRRPALGHARPAAGCPNTALQAEKGTEISSAHAILSVKNQSLAVV